MFAPLCRVDHTKLIHLQYGEQLLTIEITMVTHAFLDSRNLILNIVVNSRGCYSYGGYHRIPRQMQQLRRSKQITIFKTWTEPDLRQMQATTLL
jgi:hypothetical protein